MKHFRNLGILAIAAFSFFYTEKIANLTLDKNELYQSIKEESSKYNEEYINAFIEDDHIVPGLNGKTVNIKNSFYNMKDLNAFNSYYLIYDTSYPEITIENNKDKIVERGNEYKRSVSFILEYNENIIKYFKDNNIEASILVNVENFNKNEKLEQVNNEVNKYKELESLINKYSNNTHICYLNGSNKKIPSGAPPSAPKKAPKGGISFRGFSDNFYVILPDLSALYVIFDNADAFLLRQLGSPDSEQADWFSIPHFTK